MRGVLFFKSKLAALLVGMTAMIAVPVVGAIAIAYTILPDIGVFSAGQRAILLGYGVLCLLSTVYAYVASWMFLDEIRREYAVPGYKWVKYCIGLIILPVIGTFIMLYFYRKPSLKSGGIAKRYGIILTISTIIDCIALTILFFSEAGAEWILLVAGIVGIFHYILLITMACRLAKYPMGKLAGFVLAFLLLILFGAVGFMAGSSWIIDSQVAAAKRELANIYGHPLTGAELKKMYYHGLEPNYRKFEKILPRDPEDKTNLLALPEIPEELTCYYMSFISNKKLDAELAAWVKSKKIFFSDFDRTIKNEKYLKMPKPFRDYDEMLCAISLPELNPLRHWARTDRARIIDAIKHGNTNQALHFLKQMRRIRSYARDDSFVLSMLVGMAIEVIRLRALEAIIESGKMTAAQIQNIIKELEPDRKIWKKLYTKAMYGEVVWSIDAIERCFNQIDNDLCFWNINHFSVIPETIADKYLKYNRHARKFLSAPSYWMHSRDLLYSLKFHIVQSQIPPPKSIIIKMKKNIPDYALLSTVAVSNLSCFWDKVRMIRNEQNAAITALRVELYRRKYHQLPEKLSDLVPEFTSNVPIDMLSGKPLKYIHGRITLLLIDAREKYSGKAGKTPVEVNGYRIYSAGFNKKDEQGFYGDFKGKFYDDIGFTVIQSIDAKK